MTRRRKKKNREIEEKKEGKIESVEREKDERGVEGNK